MPGFPTDLNLSVMRGTTIMLSSPNGARSKLERFALDEAQSEMAPEAQPATPQLIRWTQVAHERSVAVRRKRIAVSAYLLAEARGFERGHEADDWLAAQSLIDAIDAGLRQA
jgi:hypothetical protein